MARLIAELDSRRRSLPRPARRLPTTPPPPADWPVEELRRFALGQTRTHQTLIPIMDHLAAYPDIFHRVPDVTDALGLSHVAVRGAMAGMTRMVKADHDFAVCGPPVRRVVVRQPDSTVHVAYSMTAEQAVRWRSVRGAERPRGASARQGDD